MTKPPKIDNPTGGRKVEEWVGKTPESVPPDHVKLRIWQRQDGHDPETGLKLKSAAAEHAQLDHEIPLSEQWRYDYPLNRESNLRYIATATTHKEKTKAENKRRAKATRGAIRHASIKSAPKRPLQSRGFAKTEKRSRELIKKLPPRRDVFSRKIIEENARG